MVIAERLEKEREREEKEKLRREKERKREEERLEKGREREEKEKLRKEKEEERRKKEDEKRREQKEEEAKKQKAKQAFKSFFVVKTIPNKSLPGGGGADAGSSGGPEDPSDGTKIGADDGTIGGIAFYNGSTFAVGAACSGSNGSLGKFKPFQLKKDMALAAIVPPAARARFDRNKIDEIIGRQLREQGEKQSDGKAADATVDNNVNSIKKADTQNESTMLYLDVLKKTNYRPLKAEKRKIHREREDTDCFVVGTENLINDQESTSGGRVRAKFLQFVENYRPAYYGTWRKTCPQITGRRPFNKFEDFDYSIDSDDEWEDVEGEVESIVGTDDEKDKEENVEDDYEEDDFFVPHGYLSESEEEESDDQPLDPAALKARIAARQEEFRAERKAGFQAKKMVAVCAVSRKGHNLEAEYQVLQQFKAVLLVASQDHPLKPSWEQEPEIINTPKSSKDHLEPKMLTDEALKVFCETAHGFQSGVRQLYEEFYKKWRSVSDVKIGLKSLKLTLTGTCKKSKNNRLVVNKDWVEKFGLKELDNDTPKEGTPSFSAKLLPDEVLPDLIKVAHGTSSTSQVITEFLNKMKDLKFGKAQVKRTLRTIAVFDHVHSCWLVRLELLKMHNLEELIKKIKAEEKPAKDKKDIHKKDTKEVVEEERTAGPGRNNKDQIAKNGFSHDSNSKDSFTNDTKSKENMPKGSTSKSLSIKKFFSSSSKGNGTLSNSSLTTPTTEGTPKVKKRIQLTTLSRTVTMKQDYKSRPVLNPEEVMVIDEDE
ncbi:chromatin assembly factor 1 subunit A-B-like [Varroa destructor]|uniref:Chromatin assembly factor 1 subunit A dimerization domain-containing protein n=1 Tax=Varroa destructor TaxID=109461 RepID=A0A7M7MEL8_VARDE|nr:chromatin assembly factor 1 subunit A-B-like [Varroa destructor]